MSLGSAMVGVDGSMAMASGVSEMFGAVGYAAMAVGGSARLGVGGFAIMGLVPLCAFRGIR